MAKKKNNDKLQYALVLFNYMLDLFGCTDLEALSSNLKDVSHEGINEEGVSNIYDAIWQNLYCSGISKEELLEHDQNIVRFTKEINENRHERPIRWKYFQYLSLLFTDIFLDKYFRDCNAFVTELNDFLHGKFAKRDNAYTDITDFTADDISKIAFWSATGSGKTLLMHVHIKQILYYAEKYDKRQNLGNILLITPNEELSKQHEQELKDSNISAMRFKSNGLFSSGDSDLVNIIEITKIQETSGDTTVAVECFEHNNIVFVDEAHRGSSGDQWVNYRNSLVSDGGFSFEYSATFGQAIGSLPKKDRKAMLNTYGKSTLFDYSYRYFYNDGYGKDYRIMNMDQWSEKESLFEYLTAYLLCLYEQKREYNKDKRIQDVFLISNPLAVFVGGTVSVSNKKNNVLDTSDVVSILVFLNSFLDDKNTFCRYIQNILSDTTGLKDSKGNSIFGNSFRVIKEYYNYDITTAHAEEVYSEILKEVFHTSAGGTLHVDNLKGLDGEVGLRVGENDYFGLVYVGDTKKVIPMCEEKRILTFKKEFAGNSLFQNIVDEDSPINILIGSKKFTEGWSCWRVSLMGLMNFGKSEGTQIIQMFGRGVRLKGYNMSLKRSSALDVSIKPEREETPRNIKVLETLNIFGLKADYMKEFKAYLEDEGLPANNSDFIEIEVSTLMTDHPKNLKIMRTDPNYDFKKDINVEPETYINKDAIHVMLDWYPKIETLESRGTRSREGLKNTAKLEPKHLSLLDWDKIFFAIERFKNEKSWYNLLINKAELKNILANNVWYTLKIPEESLKFRNYGEDVRNWTDIAITLLKLYVDKAYRNCKNKYDSKHQKIEQLKDTDPNFISKYTLEISSSQKKWIDKINALNKSISSQKIEDTDLEQNLIGALKIDAHLYNPLFYIDDEYSRILSRDTENWIHITPVPINSGEWRFVKAIRRYFEDKNNVRNKKVFLLRNISKKGIGFFENAGFYPDFILWIIEGNKQYVTFFDPKGITHLKGLKDEKIQLYRYLEKIKKMLKDDNLQLNSFIISNTPYEKFAHNATKQDCWNNHLFFEEDENYIEKIVKMIYGN